MLSIAKDGFAAWVFGNHPVFTAARERVLSILSSVRTGNLDEIVVESRTPVRTALLILGYLNATGQLPRPSASACCGPVATIPARLTDLATDRYLAAVANREKPGLLWGQRRLVPRSAIDRAEYVLHLAERCPPGGGVVFLGDDDLVSPLVAVACERPIVVFDIDLAVVERAQDVARALGGQIRAYHSDLSNEIPELDDRTDIVVCDPFPSGDGSFEAMFWRVAAALLNSEGILVTTVAPSHKPEIYARGALRMLDLAGFTLLDLHANFGRYELFEFELVDLERHLLRRLRLNSTIAHTKSLLAARYDGAGALSAPPLDFAQWTRAAYSHYLTGQAGSFEQIQLARQRGLADLDTPSAPVDTLRPELLLPATLRSDASNDPHLWRSQLGLPITELELVELASLATTPRRTLSDDSGWLALMARAVESWERWRLDE